MQLLVLSRVLNANELLTLFGILCKENSRRYSYFLTMSIENM